MKKEGFLLSMNLYAVNYLQGTISVLFQATKSICFTKKVIGKKKPLTHVDIFSLSLLVGTRIKGHQCYTFTGKHPDASFITTHHQLELWFSAYSLLLKAKM